MRGDITWRCHRSTPHQHLSGGQGGNEGNFMRATRALGKHDPLEALRALTALYAARGLRFASRLGRGPTALLEGKWPSRRRALRQGAAFRPSLARCRAHAVRRQRRHDLAQPLRRSLRAAHQPPGRRRRRGGVWCPRVISGSGCPIVGQHTVEMPTPTSSRSGSRFARLRRCAFQVPEHNAARHVPARQFTRVQV